MTVVDGYANVFENTFSYSQAQWAEIKQSTAWIDIDTIRDKQHDVPVRKALEFAAAGYLISEQLKPILGPSIKREHRLLNDVLSKVEALLNSIEAAEGEHCRRFFLSDKPGKRASIDHRKMIEGLRLTQETLGKHIAELKATEAWSKRPNNAKDDFVGHYLGQIHDVWRAHIGNKRSLADATRFFLAAANPALKRTKKPKSEAAMREWVSRMMKKTSMQNI